MPLTHWPTRILMKDGYDIIPVCVDAACHHHPQLRIVACDIMHANSSPLLVQNLTIRSKTSWKPSCRLKVSLASPLWMTSDNTYFPNFFTYYMYYFLTLYNLNIKHIISPLFTVTYDKLKIILKWIKSQLLVCNKNYRLLHYLIIFFRKTS